MNPTAQRAIGIVVLLGAGMLSLAAIVGVAVFWFLINGLGGA